ncbi:T9SS type A sorting domain-containing protein [Algibacter sp. R77976]|uniref:T9SS type A sorting domain-containing protein n=1 Tax=Algibacter sp. R77976 TaxID=3093873 RepID=UPI0037C62F77
MKKITILLFCFLVFKNYSQNLGQGYIANDLEQHSMQVLEKPNYLESVTDPSFPNTEIRRITQATIGNFIKPMYSTIQAWNADESLIIVYGGGVHQLLNGQDYTFIRNLTDVVPDDIETIFWSFSDPDVFFYMDGNTDDLISYNVQTQVKTILVNIRTISNCAGSNGLTGGNDIQMMSWDSDVFAFRCGNDAAYYYRISTQTLTQFNIANIEYTAPMPFPSGNLFFHRGDVYDANGDFVRSLNVNGIQHSCLGKLSNGDDAYYNVNFEEGRYGGCQGTLVAHNATTGYCFPVTTYADYGYPKSGTHISSLAHKNTEDGWVAVSCLGFQRDGVQLLDQELFIAKVNEFDADVYRVGHHRSDEDPFSYAGEPHVTISPTGTRLLFASDWSGSVDGDSVDSYVAELNSFTLSGPEVETIKQAITLFPNPVTHELQLQSPLNQFIDYSIKDVSGKIIIENRFFNQKQIDVSQLAKGLYFATFYIGNNQQTLKFIKE